MRIDPWWRTQFKGNIRIMLLEIGVALLVAVGVADIPQTSKYRLGLFPLVFVLVLAILMRATRKDDRRLY